MHEKAPLKLLLGESKRSPPKQYTHVVALGWLPVFKGKAHLAEDMMHLTQELELSSGSALEVSARSSHSRSSRRCHAGCQRRGACGSPTQLESPLTTTGNISTIANGIVLEVTNSGLMQQEKDHA